MPKIKLEHIDNLRRWKKSWAKIGSRWVPHHLFAHEQIHYDNAFKNKYLEITSKHRVNLQNLWYQVCEAKDYKNYVLIKNTNTNTAIILLNDIVIYSGDITETKSKIKALV
jgi:hypothetical protein